MYKAVPLKIGLSTLLQQKTQENSELLEETKALLSNIPEKTTNQEDSGSQFIITSEVKLFYKKLNKSINDTKRSIDFIMPQIGLQKHSQQLKKAMERGVKIRLILTMVDNNQSIQVKVGDLKKSKLFHLKYIPEQVVCMLISDNKELNTQISDGAVPSLLSNNKQVIRIAATYFEGLWNKAEHTPVLLETKEEYTIPT